MIFEHFESILKKANEDIASGVSIPEAMTPISNDLFGLLLWRKQYLQNYPYLQEMIPDLPPPEVQARFVGNSGEQLLPKTCTFVNYLEKMILTHSSKPFRKLNIIDYGCGWGRFTRFLLKFVELSQIRAFDQKEEILHFLDGTILSQITRIIPAIPTISEDETPADVVFLFSVFTHTPEHVTRAIASWIDNVLVPGGLLTFTIRPRLYWKHHKKFPAGWDMNTLIKSHDQRGIAYLPQGGKNPTYGDSSYTDEKIISIFRGFDIMDRTFTILDPLQIYYTLKKR